MARFHEAVGAGLRVEPAGLSDRLKDIVGLGDLRLGDAAFDAAWRVRAATLDDAGVDGRGDLPSDPGCVPEVLRLVVGLRDALRQRVSRGAYRLRGSGLFAPDELDDPRVSRRARAPS